MHKKWVVNASPLIVLARINHLLVRAGVAKEIGHGPDDDPARQWVQAHGQALVRKVTVPPVIMPGTSV